MEYRMKIDEVSTGIVNGMGNQFTITGNGEPINIIMTPFPTSKIKIRPSLPAKYIYKLARKVNLGKYLDNNDIVCLDNKKKFKFNSKLMKIYIRKILIFYARISGLA